MNYACFEHVDNALLPGIFKHVPAQTKAVLPFVCKAFREACQWVDAEWDFNEFPPRAQFDILSEPADGFLSFFAFRTTKITLRTFWMISAPTVQTVVDKFPFLEILDMQECYSMANHEWKPLLTKLESPDCAEHLQEVVTPWCRLGVTEGMFLPAAIASINNALLRVMQHDISSSHERFDALGDIEENYF